MRDAGNKSLLNVGRGFISERRLNSRGREAGTSLLSFPIIGIFAMRHELLPIC